MSGRNPLADLADDGLPPLIPPRRAALAAPAGLSSSVVVPQLREAIVSGRLAPGTRLSEQQISERFGVSRTPVREAISQLEREGLLSTVARAGVYVRRLDARDVAEIYETREALEVQAVRLAARRLTRVNAARLEEQLRALRVAAEAADVPLYVAELDRFYDVIMELATNTTLQRSYEALSGPVRWLRRIAMKHPGRMAASYEHARAIVAAIGSGNEDMAEREMREQLENARIAVTSVLSTLEGHA